MLWHTGGVLRRLKPVMLMGEFTARQVSEEDVRSLFGVLLETLRILHATL